MLVYLLFIRDPADKLIRHRACYLRDTAYALIKAEMDSDFEDKCRGIRSARSARAASPDRFAPEFVRTSSTLPIDKPVEQVTTPNNIENPNSKLSIIVMLILYIVEH